MDQLKHLQWGDFFHRWNSIEARYGLSQSPFPAHDHEFMEIHVILSGSAIHETSLGKEQVVTGDAFLFRPGAWHAYSECAELSLYLCCFDPKLLARELAWMIDFPSTSQLLWGIPLHPDNNGFVKLQLSEQTLAKCHALLEALGGITETNVESEGAEQIGLLIQILALLAGTLPKGPAVSKKRYSHPSVLAAIKLIDQDLTYPWTLTELSKRVHIAPAYLVRLFRIVAGVSPIAFLSRRRLEHSITLLKRSEYSVGEVGARVGWDDANYFARRFKAQFGLSPSAYRKRFRETRDEKLT